MASLFYRIGEIEGLNPHKWMYISLDFRDIMITKKKDEV